MASKFPVRPFWIFWIRPWLMEKTVDSLRIQRLSSCESSLAARSDGCIRRRDCPMKQKNAFQVLRLSIVSNLNFFAMFLKKAILTFILM